MADDFDDELYNVYNTVKDDAYGNTDIYTDDYKDTVTTEEPQSTVKQNQPEEEGYDPASPSTNYPNTTTSAPTTAVPKESAPPQQTEQDQEQNVEETGGGGDGLYQPQGMSYAPQPAMMAGWGQFQPNPYQYAAYQRTLQQMANPYQIQQMFQRQFRQQQQQQQFAGMSGVATGGVGSAMGSGTVRSTDEEGYRPQLSVASAANQDEG